MTLKPIIHKPYYYKTYDSKLFTKYIDHFYSKKKYAKGAERFIAKLHLNSLYGMFGRKLDMLQTITVTPNEKLDIMRLYPVKHIIDINENLKIWVSTL